MPVELQLAAWVRALAWSAGVMALILAIAVLVNVAIGRTINWDIVTALGLIGLAALTVLKRRGDLAEE